jgi:protein phosphatase
VLSRRGKGQAQRLTIAPILSTFWGAELTPWPEAHPMHITELTAGSEPRVVEAMEIAPDALVVLVGASGCGKSTFAREHFAETQVVSSDECRRLVSDDAADQAATREAFAVFYTLVRGRLTHGRLTVADATSLSPRSREKLRQAADARRRPRVAIALDVPLDVCLARQPLRARQVRADVVERGHAEFQRALHDLPNEGFLHVYVVRTEVQGAAPAVTGIDESRSPRQLAS